ncbi:1-acyl-sn-glycerol-3-phosphate acyltransferase beta-like [Crassostrea virginica]
MYLWWGLSAVAGFGFYYFSKTFQFYVKYGVFLACLLSVSTFVVAKSLLTCCGKTTKNYRFFIWGCRKVSSIYGWTYTIKGKEYVQTDGPIIAISNHQSVLDLIISSELWEKDKFPNTVVVKHTLMYYGIFGAAQFLCNTLMIDRQNLPRAIKQMKSMTEEIKVKKVSCLFFFLTFLLVSAES